MEEAERIFASDNLICCSPRHSICDASLSENQFLSSPDDTSNTMSNPKFLDISKTPSKNFLIDKSNKTLSID